MPAVLVAVLTAGCQHADLAHRRIEARRAGVARSIGLLVKRESEAPRRMGRVGAFVDAQMRQRRQTAARGIVRLERAGRYESGRWSAIQPRLQKRGRRLLVGQPGHIEPTAIWLFY